MMEQENINFNTVNKNSGSVFYTAIKENNFEAIESILSKQNNNNIIDFIKQVNNKNVIDLIIFEKNHMAAQLILSDRFFNNLLTKDITENNQLKIKLLQYWHSLFVRPQQYKPKYGAFFSIIPIKKIRGNSKDEKLNSITRFLALINGTIQFKDLTPKERECLTHGNLGKITGAKINELELLNSSLRPNSNRSSSQQ